MPSFKYKVNTGSFHTSIRVFAGPDESHLALCGMLRMKKDEAEKFIDAQQAGLSAVGAHGLIVYESKDNG